MGFFRSHAGFSTRRRYAYYGVLFVLGILLLLSLRLLANYRDAGIANYQKDRIENFRMQLRATLRSCRAEEGGSSALWREDMESLAKRLFLLFDIRTFGVVVSLKEEASGEISQDPGGPFAGDSRLFVPNFFWRDYLRFLELFPRMDLPESLKARLFFRFFEERDFCLSWKTPRGWFDILGVAIPRGDGKSREFILTFEEATNFSQGRSLYFLLSLFLVLFALLLVGVATMVYRILIKLERMAVLDKLTGAHTRGAFLEAGEKEKIRALRKRHPLSLVMVDLDNFKRVNDLHGHSTGDFVLRKVSILVRNRVRSYDLLGRWGGDEFVLLLPETNAVGASRVAEKLRRCVHEDQALEALGITVSIGVYQVEDLKESLPEIIEKADKKMYAAKEKGRNQVVC
ncbi:MAG TPA: GGDEF domain-containing protein [Synergistaceae bacterium]|nr:GGDEF domain-containing protein [Synergistaceae bacterium]HPJ25939.1 GGDEF domain-containing protein [Synergistaceae bacterium]HPQ38269.1 GGDEF domain-containing protein [Synergistaceae bacterium]